MILLLCKNKQNSEVRARDLHVKNSNENNVRCKNETHHIGVYDENKNCNIYEVYKCLCKQLAGWPGRTSFLMSTATIA